MNFEIIDFHTHPYTKLEQMLGSHREFIKNNPDDFGKELLRAGITRFAGSVISTLKEPDAMKRCNDAVLSLKERYKDSYIPGFTVDARYVSESIEQIDRAMSNGINLIGELMLIKN